MKDAEDTPTSILVWSVLNHIAEHRTLKGGCFMAYRTFCGDDNNDDDLSEKYYDDNYDDDDDNADNNDDLAEKDGDKKSSPGWVGGWRQQEGDLRFNL